MYVPIYLFLTLLILNPEHSKMNTFMSMPRLLMSQSHEQPYILTIPNKGVLVCFWIWKYFYHISLKISMTHVKIPHYFPSVQQGHIHRSWRELPHKIISLCRDHFVYVPSQWETMLQCNVGSHWIRACAEWSLIMMACIQVSRQRQPAILLPFDWAEAN